MGFKHDKIRNPNIEFRNKSKIRIFKSPTLCPFFGSSFSYWSSDIVSDFEIRASHL
jgi:hypothetical protein